MLTVLRYIEANPLRANLVERANEYPWSSFHVHGLGAADELVDRLITYEQLAATVKGRARNWTAKVHRPLDERVLERVRRSTATGLPFGDQKWVDRLAKRLHLDLSIRPRGRPRIEAPQAKK